jgi:hypothetical protein
VRRRRGSAQRRLFETLVSRGNIVADTAAKPQKSLAELMRTVGALSQSGTVLVACAVLDTELERALKTTMRPMNSAMYNRLFYGYGPLNSFSSKIDLSYALNITTDEIHANLTVIKGIRNKFAHSADVLTLESAEIQLLLRKLKKFGRSEENMTTDISSSTNFFIECVDVVVSFLGEHFKSKGITSDLSVMARRALANL